MEEQFNDEEIFRRIKARDEPFIAQLYTHYWRSFYPFILKIGQLEESIIKEIYQQSFAILCFNIEHEKVKWPMTSKLKTYFFSIGKITLHKYWDSKKGDRLQFEESLESYTDQQIQTDIDDYFNRKDKLKFIADCLGRLSPKCQKILRLKYLLGFADDAIAREMDIPSDGAVRQMRFKCLKKLKDLLD